MGKFNTERRPDPPYSLPRVQSPADETINSHFLEGDYHSKPIVPVNQPPAPHQTPEEQRTTRAQFLQGGKPDGAP